MIGMQRSMALVCYTHIIRGIWHIIRITSAMAHHGQYRAPKASFRKTNYGQLVTHYIFLYRKKNMQV